MVMEGRHPVGDHEGRVIWDLLWKAFHSERVSNGWFEHQAWYPLDCWEAAIREAVRRGKTRLETIRYVEAIASDYAANGIPVARTAPAAAGQRPAPPNVHELRRQERRAAIERRKAMGPGYGQEAHDGE
jgi:hypothetical protein